MENGVILQTNRVNWCDKYNIRFFSDILQKSMIDRNGIFSQIKGNFANNKNFQAKIISILLDIYPNYPISLTQNILPYVYMHNFPLGSIIKIHNIIGLRENGNEYPQ